MALSREERKLLHQKATQPTFGNNKPDDRQGNDGDISYRRVEGSGLVQFVKKDGKWNAVGATGNKPASRVLGLSSSSSSGGVSSHGTLTGLSADDHKQYLLISGSRAMSGNLSLGGNDIGSVGALDVDGHTTLDQVTVNTTDGAFAVSGANAISLTTTGSNDINLTSANTLDVSAGVDYELDVVGTCDWNTAITDWDNSGTFDLTSVGNVKIETSGANTEKTISIFNTNNHGSEFTGIHIKSSSQNATSSMNSILIESIDISSKGTSFGVDVRSQGGIRLRAENSTAAATNILIRASSFIDIKSEDTSDTVTTGTPIRTVIHGITEILRLYRTPGSTIATNLVTSPDSDSDYTEFQAINTKKLLRATTKIVKNSTLLFTDSTCDTTNGSTTVNFISTGNENAGLISDGMKVTGTGIPDNSIVTNKSTNSFDLRSTSGSSATANATGTNVTLSFFNYTTGLENGDFILIVPTLNNQDDDAVGTMWKISINYQSTGNVNCAQVWYVAKQNGKFAWLGNSNSSSAGSPPSSSSQGIVTWTTSNGIRWQNNTGGDVDSVKCSALKIHGGTEDF